MLENIENRYPDTNIIFSPDGRSILTGLSPAAKDEKGSLVFLNADTLEEQRKVPIGEGTVVRVVWHSRINQVCSPLPRRHCTTHSADFGLALHRCDPRIILTTSFHPRSPIATRQTQAYCSSRRVFLIRRCQTCHFHSRRSTNVRGREVRGESASKGEEG